MKEKLIRIIKKISFIILIVVGAAFLFVVISNLVVILSTIGRIIEVNECADKKADCIIVLGAGVKPDGKPSLMLQDRLDKAVELYEAGASGKIIVSGDHRSRYYDEVNTMKRYLVDKGIPSEVVYMDHAGLSTYDTMHRAVNIFSVKKAIIVTQQYHMYRALFDARALGIDAYGVCSVKKQYGGQAYRDIREVAARIKDLGYSIFKPSSEVKGEKISLSESGDVTND